MMAEFAIVAAVFSMMVLGVLEAGVAAWQKNSVAADAREGVRYAAVHGTRSQDPATPAMVTAYVKTRTSLDTAGIRVYTEWPSATCPCPNKEVGSPIKVSVAHNVRRIGPFIPAHVDSATAQLIVLF
jgi:Flp pilus assembly protein TadG